ncbi:glycosyltransferase [Geobacter sp. OR-1]|uniref:CgeB family protein n=1 Tax=Geobacter sp. OR-1 TaxID=1266765 RepID=UPI001364AB49|nr:glycosyltransferase [Geobacter sp. OR-1]
MGDNDVVCLMARDLAALCDLVTIDTGLYSSENYGWFEVDASLNPQRPIHWLDHDRVIAAVNDARADFIIVNSGGMSLRPETAEKLRSAGVATVGISLSDPDVYQDHGIAYAHLYDLYYSNSMYSLKQQYPKNLKVRWLPFAASPSLHRPMPQVPKTYDVVIVGHARPERIQVVNSLKRYFSVGLFGSGWGYGSSAVHGEEHVRAINSGRIYLSFSATVAGYMNVKVGLLEAAACRTCLITKAFAEVEKFFRSGMEIYLYKDTDDLVASVRHCLSSPYVRDWLAENSYARFLSDHTWESRWNGVIHDVRQCKLG